MARTMYVSASLVRNVSVTDVWRERNEECATSISVRAGYSISWISRSGEEFP